MRKTIVSALLSVITVAGLVYASPFSTPQVSGGSGGASLTTANTWSQVQTFSLDPNFVAGVEFIGSSGANLMTVPDNQANALDIVSTDGKSYAKVVSTNSSEQLTLAQNTAVTGTLTLSAGLTRSSGSFSGAGTTQAGATAITAEIANLTTTGGNTAFVLPTPVVGQNIWLSHVSVAAGESALVFPASGHQINALGANNSFSVSGTAFTQGNVCWAVSTTRWYCAVLPYSTSAGATIRFDQSVQSAGAFSGTNITGTGTLTIAQYAGTTSITATSDPNSAPLTTEYNLITTCASGNGVQLQTAALGKHVFIRNEGSNTCKIYPVSGSSIDTLSATVPLSLVQNASVDLAGVSATKWDSGSTQFFKNIDATFQSGMEFAVNAGGTLSFTDGSGGTAIMTMNMSGTPQISTAATSDFVPGGGIWFNGTTKKIFLNDNNASAFTLDNDTDLTDIIFVVTTNGSESIAFGYVTKYSTSASVAAAGSTSQATATQLTSEINVITSATAVTATGVALLPAATGLHQVIKNRGSITITLFPNNAQDDAICVSVGCSAADAGVTIAANASLNCYASDANTWECI